MTTDAPANEDRKALMVKLGRARKAVQPIEKSGHNKDEGFDFVEAVKVTEEANRVLATRGILILPSVEASRSDFLTGGVLTKVKVTYEIVDTDTGYSFEKKGIGHGFDKQGDRAIYKATTGAAKYFLAGLLSIPFVGRDPEHDGDQALPAGEPEPEPGQSAEARKAAAEQDAAAEAPDITPARERPLPESDLPAPDWDGLDRPTEVTAGV